ncbi:MAG: hypothetical protein QGH59_10325 [Gemmatimonadota bacterium]|nr:hypothetical protein [Gemmatimonadota bacterium]
MTDPRMIHPDDATITTLREIAEPLARHDHPATAHAAGEAIRPHRATIWTQVLVALRDGAGPEERTAREFVKYNDLPYTVHKRLPEMARRGLIVRGEIRRCIVSGRNATTWRLR